MDYISSLMASKAASAQTQKKPQEVPKKKVDVPPTSTGQQRQREIEELKRKLTEKKGEQSKAIIVQKTKQVLD